MSRKTPTLLSALEKSRNNIIQLANLVNGYSKGKVRVSDFTEPADQALAAQQKHDTEVLEALKKLHDAVTRSKAAPGGINHELQAANDHAGRVIGKAEG